MFEFCGTDAQCLPVPDDNSIARGVDARDVEAPIRRYAESPPLTDGEMVNAAVIPENVLVSVDDFTHSRKPIGTDALDRRGVVALGNEADLLALGLLRRGESEGARFGTHCHLGEFAERKSDPSQLLLLQLEQEVRLVFFEVCGASQAAPTRTGIRVHASVMTRRHRLSPQNACALEQVIELETGVAGHARDRRATGQVGIGEALHDFTPETLSIVGHEKTNSEPLGDAPGIVRIGERTTAGVASRQVERDAHSLVPCRDDPGRA